MGLFPDENINWYQKLAVMIRNRLLASAGQLLPLWRAWPISLGLPCPPALWVCSTSSFVDLLPTALQGKSKSSARLKKKYRYIYSKKPPKKLLKIGRGKGLPRPALSWWWLTDWGPRVSKWWWVWILTQIDTGSVFPQGWITPTTQPPLVPLRRRGRGPQDAPRGSYRFCSDLWNNINFHAAARHPPPIQEWIKCVQKKTLYYILFYLSTLRLVPPNGYYIRDTSSFKRY